MTLYKDGITGSEVRELFSYDPETGKFERKAALGKPRSGDGKTSKGYATHLIDGKLYFEHVLIWLYVYNSLPMYPLRIDHENQIKTDNRKRNLRAVTQRVNCLNTSDTGRSETKLRGVYKTGSKFCARIRVNTKLKYLGTFDTAELASTAYEQEREKQLNECRAK